jgi:RNA polymerase sigma factor (sigma-70 family)
MIMHTPSTSGSLADRAANAFRSYLEGDPESMGELIDLLTPLLWHVARGQRLDQATAEDVVQTAWMRLVEHAERLDDAQSVMKWLVVTVRRESWRLVKQQRSTDLGLDESGSADDNAYGMNAPGPESAAVAGDEQRRLWSCIARLPQRCQALLRVIAFAERPDYATLAQALGMPVGSIGPTRGRCLAKLRAALERDDTWGGQLA